MPTYEYVCERCGIRFERQQAVTEAPLTDCPECRGKVHRLISGGAGFILKGQRRDRPGPGREECSLEQSGRTCCGRSERCGKPSCEGE
ncbi:putative regulatory protein FmdB [Thermacetogenium phaeum DSM 12270]|jgi:putative FmdB family regulatory protein|uniref:Putative regulatory protein FmdB n=1 Tax=Thermacetogenium phaeum (strain ATCC BAA-254 / DSM 26808 / PB) TaxID=1089553 RepID=K4LKG7_THEPS|nr:zinc ribbon domain-containing protein [Thermacetogenium phaeum]AFV12450.1 putative regulatory protein FmdB [Thermacetogenium phaeum DSM 12270]